MAIAGVASGPGMVIAGVAKGYFDFMGSYADSMALQRKADYTLLLADYERATHEINARYSDFAAEDSLRRGHLEATRAYARGQQIRGAQKTSYAGQGVAVNSGSAAALQLETEALTEQDMLKIKSNAWRESFGHKVQADESRFRGKWAKLAGNTEAAALRNKATNTLLGGYVNLFTGGLGAVSNLSDSIISEGKSMKGVGRKREW